MYVLGRKAAPSVPPTGADAFASAPAPRQGGHRGQATVELAIVLPLIALLLLAVVQVALVVRAHVLVTHAAREAARAAAVDAHPAAARRAAVASSVLDPDRLAVDVGHRGRPGGRVRVHIRYRMPTEVPLVGILARDLELAADATMQVEGPPSDAFTRPNRIARANDSL